MSRDYPAVAAGITVGELVRGFVLPTGRRYFLVVDDGRLQGLVTLHNIRSVSQAEWETTLVNAVMTPAAELKTASPGQSALSVMEMMGKGDINQVPVVSDGQVVGVVARDNLLRFLRTRAELRV
jgi:CBS domain-containing protein